MTKTPDRYPFCLTDREFRYYGRTYFGDTIPNLDGIYHPPSFFRALLEDIGGVRVGVLVARFLPVLIPQGAGAAAAISPSLAVAGSRAEVGAAVGGLTAHLLPGGSWDAANKAILWPRYQADYYRRLMQ